MTDEVRVYLPGPEPSDDIKKQTYLLRGEAVAAGGTAEWIIRALAAAFTTSRQSDVGRLWEDIKAALATRGLTAGLQAELRQVADYFSARNLAAHASIIIFTAGADHQVIRLSFSKGQSKAEVATISDLEADVAAAKNGYVALQAAARALDLDDSVPLSGLGSLQRLMLLGTTTR